MTPARPILDKVLEATLAGTAEQKVSSLTIIIYNLAKERFGSEEKKGNIKKAHQPSRGEREIHRLREEIKALKSSVSASARSEGRKRSEKEEGQGEQKSPVHQRSLPIHQNTAG